MGHTAGAYEKMTAALAPVLRELERLDGVRLRVEDEDRLKESGRAGAMVWGCRRVRLGVQVELGRPVSAQIVSVADEMQEVAVEALWRLGRPTNWPGLSRASGDAPARGARGWRTGVLDLLGSG